MKDKKKKQIITPEKKKRIINTAARVGNIGTTAALGTIIASHIGRYLAQKN